MPAPSLALPQDTVQRLLGDSHGIARRMTRAIATSNSLPESFGSIRNLRAVTQACRDAIETLLRLLIDGQGLRQGDLDRLGAMGAREARNNLPLEVLLGAYRIAARVLWQDVISESVQRNELPADTVVAATSSVLEYLDLISGAVGSAYLETRERLVLQRHSERDRILQRLLAGEVASEIQHMAAAVDLKLSPPYQVLAFSSSAEQAGLIGEAWHKLGGLVVASTPEINLVLASPQADAAKQHHAMQRAGITSRCVVGPVCERLEDIAAAARTTESALSVAAAVDPNRRFFDYSELAAFSTLRGDAAATQAFVEHAFRRLESLRGKKLEDALQTIEAVVVSPSLAAAAASLAVHRHTLVYRLERLSRLGIDLQDPTTCHQLWLALQLKRIAQVA